MSAVKPGMGFLLSSVLGWTASALDTTPSPGPLVEAGIESPQGAKRTGYMLSYKDGTLTLRPLDGSSDQTFHADELATLHFLPDPVAPAALEKSGPGESASPATSPGLPEKSYDPSDDNRHANTHARAKLEKLRELGDMECLKILSEKERLRYIHLNRQPTFRMSPLESSEYDGLRSKMGLLPIKQLQRIRDEVGVGVSKEGAERLLERLRQHLYAAPSFEEARKHILSVFYAQRLRETELAMQWPKVLGKLGEDVDKIKNAEVRKEVKANSKDFLLDFISQGLRTERERERFERSADRERP